jgi:hypothetical protein
MSGGLLKNNWRFWLAAVALVWPAAVLRAQPPGRETGYEFQWFNAYLQQKFLGIEVEAEDETSRLNGGSAPYHRDHVYIAPTVGLELEGSVYHPNLLSVHLMTEIGASWQEQTLSAPNNVNPAGTETRTQFLGRYDAELQFLKQQPYAVYFTAARDHNNRQYDFFNRATVDTERYGLRTGYNDGPVPFTVTFRNWVEDVNSFLRPSHLEETTVSLDARNERSGGDHTTLSYKFDQYARRERGTFLEEGTYHTVNVSDLENLGGRGRTKLNSILFFNQLDTRTTSSRSLNVQEQLRTEHSERLQSDYLYRFDNLSLAPAETLSHSGQATLYHRLYDNLSSSLDAHGYTLDSSSPNSTYSTVRYGVGLSEGYTRRLGTWGRLTLGNNLHYDQTRQNSTGQYVSVMREPHTLTDGIITYLNQPRVLLSSVRVTDVNGMEYQLLLDYTLIEHGELIEIRRVPFTSTITNGAAIWVDYQVLASPADSYSTLANQCSFRLDLFQDLVGLYARLNTVENYGGHSLVLQNVFDVVAGVECSWRWARVGAEYEDYQSTLASFTTKRLFQSLTFDLDEGLNLNFNFDEQWTTFLDSGIERASYNANSRLRTQLTSHLFWENEGGVRFDRGPGFDQTLFVARSGLTYLRGELAVKIDYDFQDQDYLGGKRERHFVTLRVRRTF